MTNAYRLEGSLAFLTVGGGVETCVDAEDLQRVLPYTWRGYGRQNAKHESTKYVQAAIDGKTTYLHRLVMDAPPGIQVDHFNHDTLDNRKANLRLVQAQENCMNRDGAYATSKTGVRGVSEHLTSRGRLMYVFRCHGEECRDATYFPHTEHGLEQAKVYGEAHYAGLEPPAWTLERPPVIVPNRKPAKLSDDDVREIRRSATQGKTYQALGNAFGISSSLVSMIVSRKRRKYVTD